MKHLSLATIFVSLFLTACGSSHDKCEDARDYQGCMQAAEAEKERRHEREMARIENPRFNPYAVAQPVGPGSYTNYYGNSAHGYYDAFGRWNWYDPSGMYARQTASFMIGAGISAALMNSWTRSDYETYRSSPSYKKTVVVNNYISSDGKKISKDEYTSRKSKFDNTVKSKTTSYTKKHGSPKKTPEQAKKLVKTQKATQAKTLNKTGASKTVPAKKPLEKKTTVKPTKPVQTGKPVAVPAKKAPYVAPTSRHNWDAKPAAKPKPKPVYKPKPKKSYNSYKPKKSYGKKR